MFRSNNVPAIGDSFLLSQMDRVFAFYLKFYESLKQLNEELCLYLDLTD